MITRRTRRIIGPLVAVIAIAGCGSEDEPSSPTISDDTGMFDSTSSLPDPNTTSAPNPDAGGGGAPPPTSEP